MLEMLFTEQQTSVFQMNLDELEKCDYYYKFLSKENAEDMIRGHISGHYLIRNSSSQKHYFVITFTFRNKINHVRVIYTYNTFYLDGHYGIASRNIFDLIMMYKRFFKYPFWKMPL